MSDRPDYLHTKPRGTNRAHIFEWTPEGTTGGYTPDALEAVCGGTKSYGRFYTGLPRDANVDEEDVCGNCRRVIEAREEGVDAVSAHEREGAE